jgi:hypothetical protein
VDWEDDRTYVTESKNDDRPRPNVVERALKLQKGSVLAREVERLRDELGMEMGMRSVAVDELESLRRELWQLLSADQLSDEDTLDRLRARVRDLEAGREVEQDLLRVAALRISVLERRDTAAAAVDINWRNPIGPFGSTLSARSIVDSQWPGLPDDLDELVRVRREGER